MSEIAFSVPDALVDAIARRVVELLPERPAAASPYLDVAEAAEYLRASRQRLYDLTNDGRLTPRRDGRRLLFTRDDLDAYLEGRQA